MRLIWRAGLRGRIILLFCVITAVTVVITTGILVLSARNLVLQNAQNAALKQFVQSVDAAYTTLPPQPSDEELQTLAEKFPSGAGILNLNTGGEYGNPTQWYLSNDELAAVVNSNDPISYQRHSSYGQLTFVMKANGQAGPPGSNGDRLVIFWEVSLQSEADLINQLVALGIVVSLVLTPVVGIIGYAVGTRFTRPLKQMERDAHRMGTGDSTFARPTGYSDIDSVLMALRETSESLDTTMQRLSSSEQRSRRLVADVAHELRTPLTAMGAMAEILADTSAATQDEVKQAGASAARNTAHLTELVNSILDLSRIDADRATVQRDTVEVWPLVNAIIDVRGWRDDVGVTGPHDATVATDESRLRMIVSNLIANAVEHGIPPVSVEFVVSDAELVLTVTDRGPGIPAEHAPHVFERFYRVSASRTSSGNSGIGLAIARENARLLGGDITIAPTAPTRFEVRLPGEPPARTASVDSP